MQVPGAEPLPTTFGAVSMSSEFGRTTILRPSPLHRMIDLADRVAIVTGAFHTGDLAVCDEDGFIQVVDRMKDLIISGGFNIAPSEIEAVISGVPGVEEVCVIPAADEKSVRPRRRSCTHRNNWTHRRSLITAGITWRATRFGVSCSLSHPRSRGWQAERSRGDTFRPRTPRLPRPSGDSDSPSPPVDASRVADF